MPRRQLVLVFALAAAACGSEAAHPDDAAAPAPDLSVAADLAPPPPDLRPPPDLTPPPDLVLLPAPGCNADGGIQCDGDWAGKCTPACAAGECCSPQAGHFQCVARDAAGLCPLADLFIDASRIDNLYSVEWAYFPANDCAIVEGCVGASGWRRLLKFDTWTPNIGNADLFLGNPTSATSTYFVYSSCHMHYHFNTYADYSLTDASGASAATGHKQAFCLEDYYHYPSPLNMSGAVYDCSYQGIEMGWQDVYKRTLDCQWIDITDVLPGDYNLNISLNTAHLLAESDYSNDSAQVAVTIPVDVLGDPTVACTAGETGPRRDCGWTAEASHTCTPGDMVTVACSSQCGLGSCTGDTVMRVCDSTMPCVGHAPADIATNDDSGCNGLRCNSGSPRECCSQVKFTCPASGTYNVLWAPYDSNGTATCNVATNP
jgi:Lysyl oxidase